MLSKHVGGFWRTISGRNPVVFQGFQAFGECRRIFKWCPDPATQSFTGQLLTENWRDSGECRQIVIGDSIANRIPKWAMPGIVNMGKEGDIISGVEARLRFSPPSPDDTLLITVGINDLMRRKADAALADYDHLLRTLPPVRRVVVSAIPPVNVSALGDVAVLSARVARYNAGLARLARRHHAAFVDARPVLTDRLGLLRRDLTYDGIHINWDGYAVWAPVLLEAISYCSRGTATSPVK